MPKSLMPYIIGLAACLATTPTPSMSQEIQYMTAPPAAGPAQVIGQAQPKPSKRVAEISQKYHNLPQSVDIDQLLTQIGGEAKCTENLESLATNLKGYIILVPMGTNYKFEQELESLAQAGATFYVQGGHNDMTGLDKDGIVVENALKNPLAHRVYLSAQPQYDYEDNGDGTREAGLAQWITGKKMTGTKGTTNVIPVDYQLAPGICEAIKELGQKKVCILGRQGRQK